MQLAAGEREEHALEARHLDPQRGDARAELGEDLFDEGIVADQCQFRALLAGQPVGEAGGDRIAIRLARRGQAEQGMSMRLLQRLRRIEREQLAAIDDADAVAVLHLLDVMGGDHDGDAALGAEAPQIAPDALARLGVEADGRLVEQQDLGIMDQRAGDLEPALHARGQRAHRLRRPVGELDEVQHLLDAVAPQLARHAEDEAMQLEVLAHRQAVVEARLLEDDAEPPAGGERLSRDIGTADQRDAAVGRQDGAEDVHQRRLAGAVGSEQREQLLLADREADLVERQRPPVALGDGIDADGLGRRRRWGRRFWHHGAAAVAGNSRLSRISPMVPSAVSAAMASSIALRRNFWLARTTPPTPSVVAGSGFGSRMWSLA